MISPSMYHGEFVMHGYVFHLAVIRWTHIVTWIVPISMSVTHHTKKMMIIINP